ncbi:MAG: hypothetical protein GWN62_11780 [Aliifodinibius sp.]|nr:hypothetical protein [Fodinibius sp.]
MILIPAYGRRYKDIQDAIQAWESGADFCIANGPYCSIRDFQLMKSENDFIELWASSNWGSEKVTIWDADPLANYVPTTWVKETP